MAYVNFKEKFPAAFPKLSPAQMAQIAEVALGKHFSFLWPEESF